MKNVMSGPVELSFTSCCVDIHHSMAKIKRKSCKRLPYNLWISAVISFLNIGQVWAKRSSKARQLVTKMLAKRS